MSNGAHIYSAAKKLANVDVTLTGISKQLPALAIYGPKPRKLRNAGIQIDGDDNALDTLSSLLGKGKEEKAFA